MPKVSVILTSYNHEKFIKYAIESVLNQSFKDYEFIIWDDCSTDKSWEIIQNYNDSRIKAVRNEVNMGSGNVNRALDIVSGEYVAINHSDDEWMPDKLEKQVKFLDENPEYGAVFTLIKIIDEDGSDFYDPNNSYTDIFNKENRTRFEWLNYFFYYGNCLCHPSILIRKEYYKERKYDQRYLQLPDFDFWIRLCLKSEIFVLQEKLLKFRRLDNNANASAPNSEKIARHNWETIKILENYFNISNKDAFVKIFPGAKNYNFKFNKTTCAFLVALFALNTKHASYELFALDTFYNLLGTKEEAEILKTTFNFTYRSFHGISWKCTIDKTKYSQLFINYGKEFIEEDSINKPAEITEKRIKFDIEKYENIQSLRFDPVNDFLIMKMIDLEIITNEKEVTIVNDFSSNARFNVNGTLYFYTKDPQIFFDLECYNIKTIKEVIINLNIISIGESAVTEINKLEDEIINNKNIELNNIKNSLSYKIVDIILYPMRSLYKLIKRIFF